MRSILTTAFLLASGISAVSQLQDGDLIATLQWPSSTVAVRPSTGTITTLAVPPAGTQHTYAQMASDNRNVLFLVNDLSSGPSAVVSMDPIGRQTTLASSTNFQPRGFELDHDGTWIIASAKNNSCALWRMDDLTSALFSLYQRGQVGFFTEMCIDRDPLAPPYVIVNTNGLLGSDRNGTLTTIVPVLPTSHGVELDPRSGDYLVTCQGTPQVARVTRFGSVMTVSTAVFKPSAARFAADGTAWVTHNARPTSLYRIDMQGRVISMLPVSSGSACVGIEIYGSRTLMCRGTGKPGTSVAVALESRKLGDGGKPYALACSFLRQPGLRMPNGEWLSLTPDALFTLSLSGAAPAIFVNFQGVTDPFGAARARIDLPSSLPRNLKITVFVAGVIFDAGGIRTVTNTHWTVLD